MLVVCRVCASEYSIGGRGAPARGASAAVAHAHAACIGCEDDSPPARRIDLESPLRLPVRARERGLPRQALTLAHPPSAKQRLTAAIAGFVRAPAFLASLAGLAMTSAVLARAGIVTVLPQTAVLYAAAGLPVHLGGLVLRESRSVIETQDGQPVLVVTGRLHNVTRSRLAAPPVTITLRGSAGESLYSWRIQPSGTEVAAGDGLAFRGRLAAPPAGLRDVELALAPSDSAPSVASGPRRPDL